MNIKFPSESIQLLVARLTPWPLAVGSQGQPKTHVELLWNYYGSLEVVQGVTAAC